MTIEPSCPSIASYSAECSAVTTEELRSRLVDRLAHNACLHLEIAAIIGELERRGEDMVEIRRKVGWSFHYLRRAALGSLEPDLLVRFLGCKQLLRMVSSLSMTDQKEIIEKGTVPLLERSADGSLSMRRCDPLQLSPHEIRQVFASGHIRDREEQHAYQRRAPQSVSIPLQRIGPYRDIDCELGTAKVGTITVSVTDSKAFVALVESNRKRTAKE